VGGRKQEYQNYSALYCVILKLYTVICMHKFIYFMIAVVRG